jgi:arylsulfatase A-like enzyme
VDLRLRTVRTRDCKMTVELDSGAGELYDLVNDPGEMVNRYDDPAYAAARREMHDMIASRPQDTLAEPLEQVGMA